VVSAVDPSSPAARAGLAAGDLVVTAEGEPLRDIIDWQWLSDGQDVTLDVRRHGTTSDRVVVTREPGEAWGIAFTQTVFDEVRTCRNRCAFCFMAQLPRGLRRALYLRDDDYRLSFLQGNFVTLTNLSDADVARIVEQHLSPLYVSFHAADPAVREELICAREDRALERLDGLLEAGIDVHVQIVLVPGVNDDEVLERSLRWLAEREGVVSVGIVPLGYTAHQNRFPGSYGDPAAAAEVIAQVEPWRQAFRQRDGVSRVHLADEFYLNAGTTLPPAEEYDGFPQYENGIGLVRDWLDESAGIVRDLAAAVARAASAAPVALVTGTLFAPVLETTLAAARIEADVAADRVFVLPVTAGFFGGNVSVTGLLTGADLVPAIAALAAGTVALVPDIVVNADGLLLDDVVAADLPALTGRDVRLVSCDAGGLLGGLDNVAAAPPEQKE
jgi:putative radical SAM enzyme (TIGR03279 family)